MHPLIHVRYATVLVLLLGSGWGAGIASACSSDAECFSFGSKCFPGTHYCDANGSCTVPSALSCDDADACTDDSCQENAPGNGCVHTLHCPDDGQVCNGVAQCVPFQFGQAVIPICVAGVPPNCDDGNACTIDSCIEPSGCTHVAVDCNDGRLDTRDVCDVQQGCLHFPIAAQLVACKTNADCANDACTAGRVCTAGACTAGQPTSCDDGDPCTVDACDVRAGCSHTAIAGCCASDANCAASGDPCAPTTCGPAHLCESQPKSGLEALTCACQRTLPAVCAGQPLPAKVTQRLQHACALVAQVRPGGASRKLVSKAANLFGSAARALGGRGVKGVAGACVTDLKALVGDDHGRAESFLDQL